MKSKFTALLTIALLLCLSISFAQSLTLQDLINLQKSNLEKAKGFFSYKGYTWSTSDIDKADAVNSDGFDLSYDIVKWQNNSEEAQYLTKAGFENVIFYYTNENHFLEIENEAKNQLSKGSSNVTNSLLWSSYKGQNIDFYFNTKKIKENYSVRTVYEICVINNSDVEKRRNKLCSNCKGKGQIIEYEKCRYCSGDGKQDCEKCDGKGKLFCENCKEGQIQCNGCWGKGANQCNTCWGKGSYQCDKCWGKGTIQCSKCYGNGTYQCNICYGNGKLSQCPKCNGAGKISATAGPLVMTSTCSNCNGTGRGNFTCENCGGTGKLTCSTCGGLKNFTCENCTGTGKIKCTKCVETGKITCSQCVGTGKINCSYCKGNYSSICPNCNGTGNTDLVCTHCNGKGITNSEIKKVCPICKGSKLKQP